MPVLAKATKAALAASLVDRLGDVKAEIADLEKKEKELRDEFVSLGLDSADGSLFHATVSRYDRVTTDWKALKEEYHPPKFLEMVEKHSRSTPAVTVKVFSR